MRLTVLSPIATANPSHCAYQNDAALNSQRLPGLSRSLANRVPAVYKLSGIDKRYTCLEEYAQKPGDPDFDPQSWPVSPYSTTGVRNLAYRQHSTPLALSCATDAIANAKIDKSQITHVVVTSCTGFFAPGLDIELVDKLGLNTNVQRTLIGFMGCYAAFNALRVADSFCKSQPNACVLIVCLELCSLHFRVENTLESVAVNSLFADGCASVIVRPMDENDPQTRGLLTYERAETILHSESSSTLTWDIGDHGYIMGLSNDVPDILGTLAPSYVEKLLNPLNISKDQIAHWAIHPGGRRIVEAVQASLGLCECDVAESFEILRNYGNMSSPTILFVLQRILTKNQPTKGEKTVAMAFGPGLTIEGCFFHTL